MLKIDKMTGGYRNLPVLKEVTFAVPDGQLVGLIGLNGAGKSTTIKEIIGLLRPYQGHISIDELSLDQDSEAFRKKIGYIPETPSLYEELTLKEHLEVVAMSYDIPIKQAMQRAQGLLETFRLADRLEWYPVNFSKGMKQKVMIICALIVNPRLLIVDEPFLGLDPIAINDLTHLLDQAKQKGTAILMSTHVLDAAERMCDSFVILHQGKVRAQGSLADLRDDFGQASASLNDIYMALTKEV